MGEFRITAFFLLTIKSFFEITSGLNACRFVWTSNSRPSRNRLSSAGWRLEPCTRLRPRARRPPASLRVAKLQPVARVPEVERSVARLSAPNLLRARQRLNGAARWSSGANLLRACQRLIGRRPGICAQLVARAPEVERSGARGSATNLLRACQRLNGRREGLCAQPVARVPEVDRAAPGALRPTCCARARG